ncbi:MAG: SGNH/GDSL hydrolase family protein [Planctomycetota bacterium]|nr:SGNH/GDSL hydrolase family protein [Planctomycetota bacterium]
MAHVILITLVVGFPVVAVWVFRKIWTGTGRCRGLAVRATLFAGTCLLIFGGLEYVFVNHVAISDGFGFTLSAGNWRRRYGSVPHNQWGWRDQDHTVATLRNKSKLMVVGDSFTAGHGINDYRDRYANRLADKLGDQWKMILIAKGGWDTEKQIEEFTRIHALIDSPATEEIVIWQYYINDIEQAGATAGLQRPTIHLTAPRGLRPLVDNFHVANFAYWSVFRRFSTRQLAGRYLAYLEECYTDAMCWSLHQRQLQKIVGFSQRSDKSDRRMVVIVYPNLMDISATRKMSDRVVEYFQGHELPVINMADLLQDQPVEDITVNAFDGHANEKVNQLLADELYRQLQGAP